MAYFKRAVSLLSAAAIALWGFTSCENGSGSIFNPVIYTDPVINELMADNSVTLADGSGAYHDWIEIYNPTSRAVELSGYGLSDNPNQPFKYVLPDVTLNKGEYLIIFMDGENRYTDGELHGSFKLSAAGDETVIFTNPNGKQLSAVTVAACPADISVGLVQDGGGDEGSYVYFSSPTPGKANAGNYSFSPQSEGETETDLPLLINEYMKSKNTVLLDEDGDYSAWAEIYNPSEEAVDLSGCYLSDDSSEPDKWQFPQGVSLGAGEFLTVYLSGKDKVSDGGEIHASFKLSDTDTCLLLSDKLLRKADHVETVSLTATLSYGRSEADSGVWLYYTRPTPGKANTTVGFEDLSSGVVAPFGDGVYISETMSLNSDLHKNSAGEYTDWIELYNPTDEAVDLSGWYISDDLDEPCFFELPSGTEILSGGYLTLYAAGMSGTGSNGDIYLPFSLSAEGETLVLSSSEKITADVFQTGRHREGISSGRILSSDGSRVFFTEPSPGEANGDKVKTGYTASPVFSVDGGCVGEERITVSLTCEDGAVIYYTLDGSDPSPSSFVYSDPLILSTDCVLRAVAVREGRLISDTVSRTYIFSQSHDLPVVCLSSDPEGLFSESNGIYATGYGASSEFPYKGANYWKDWERAAGFEFYTEGGELGVFTNCGIAIHGQYSRAQAQKSFKVKLRGKYGSSEMTYPFFSDYDVSTFKSFILRSGGQDHNSLKLRDAFFTQVIKGQMDVDYMEYRFCALYINGEYWGLYCIREHTNEDYIESHRGIDSDNVDLIKGSSTVKAGDKEAYTQLLNWMKTADLTVQENFDYAASKIDLESWMNWWITETFFSNTDTGNIKFYCERSESGKWRWILFDMDWGMWPSTYQRNRLDRMLDPDGHGSGSAFSTVFARKLLSNEEFENEFVETYAMHLNTTFAPERMYSILDSMADEIRTEIPKNYDRWGELKESSWERNITRMKEMLAERAELSKQHLQDTFDLSDERMKELFPDWEE